MKPIAGFTDVYGADLRRRRFLGQAFGSIAESFGFEPLEVPIVERAEAYSEEIVGLSPWPEWNARGMFSLALPNYGDDYADKQPATEALLIPEGTLSVTRWLGDKLSQDPAPRNSPLLPLKIYYEVSCYRNELLRTLSPTKGRQFTQFGIEILGSNSICADLEVMTVSAEALLALGVSDASILFRVSSNRLYSDLSRETGLSHAESVELKEILDTLGECKAGKRAERLPEVRASVLELLERKQVAESIQNLWLYIIDRPPSTIHPRDFEVLGRAHSSEVEYLQTVCSLMGQSGLSVVVDFCVVRSHEYYTGLTFEIDLIDAEGTRHVEVGGGGRYDRLLGNFIETAPGLVIPSIGYAFGLERLQNALVRAGHLQGAMPPISQAANLASDAIIRQDFEEGRSDEETGARYLRSVRDLRERRRREPVSMVFGAQKK